MRATQLRGETQRLGITEKPGSITSVAGVPEQQVRSRSNGWSIGLLRPELPLRPTTTWTWGGSSPSQKRLKSAGLREGLTTAYFVACVRNESRKEGIADPKPRCKLRRCASSAELRVGADRPCSLGLPLRQIPTCTEDHDGKMAHFRRSNR